MFNKNIFWGNRILYFVSVLLILTVVLTVYLMRMIRNSELSLLEQQRAKLNQAAYSFDHKIEGSLRDYLDQQNTGPGDREKQIYVLGEYVNRVIAEVSLEYPEIHIGLYFTDLDVFFDGTQRFLENYSLRRKKAFEAVLQNKSELVQNLGEQEGGIVEIYKPFARNGRVEGVIRSAEYLGETSFYNKCRETEYTVYPLIALVVVAGIAGAVLIVRQFVNQVENIKNGLKLLEKDLNQVLPPASGELGEIVDAINGFAHKIADLNLYNETMLESIDDAILVVDVEGRIMIANNMARKLMRLPGDYMEKNYRQLLPAGSPFIELIDGTLRDKNNCRDLHVSWINEQNHHATELLISTSVLFSAKNRVIGMVLLCRDITERVRLREKAQRQERLAALGKLVAGVAHEIRNPLTSISVYIQHWQNHHTPNERALSIIYREVARLDAIVDQLLYFAKPAQAKFEPRDINELIEEVFVFFKEIQHGKYALHKELDRSIPRVWVDPEQIERVLVNILFNAVQAMPEGGTITVSTAYSINNDLICVSISDTGNGIPRENLNQLFDPFFSTRPKGTGLGLAIAHEIIKAHGGDIEIESEIGKGTKFIFYLRTREDG